MRIGHSRRPVLEEHGESLGRRASDRDITERKLADNLLHVRMRLMEFAAIHSLEEILQKTLDEVGELIESPIGFYHFVDEDQQTLSLQAWSTRTVQEFCTAQGKGSHYNISDAGVWVDCIHQRRPVIHNDYNSLPHRKGMPEGHAQVTRELVVPILRGGRIVAILGVGNKRSEYTEKDVELVSYLADVAWEIAKRKQAEEALRESEERLKRSQEIAHLGSWELDLVQNRLTWSDEVYRIFGLEPQEFSATYEAFLEAVHPDDRVAVDAAYSASLRENRDTYEIEHRVVRKSSGEVRLVHERCQHLWDATGRIVRSVGMVHDITESKRMEEALHTQAEQYSTIVATTSDGFWLVDDNVRLLDVNDAYCQMSGYTREELLRLCISDLEAVENADETVHHMHKIIESGYDRFETRHRAKDGRLFDVEISTTFLVSKRWFIVFIRDITERKAAAEALENSLQRFALLAETAGELLQAPVPQKVVDSLCRKVMERLDCHAFFNFLVDEHAGRLHLNACAGIPEEEARKIEWLDYGVAVCGCVARDHCRIVAEHIPTTPDVRTQLVKSYGIKAYACHPLLGVGGRLIGTLSFGTRSRETFSPDDLSLMKAVTDQVAAAMIRMQGEQALRASEEELRRANEQLEEKVRERTAELMVLTQNLVESRDQLRSLASELVVTEARERRALASVLHDTVAQMLAIGKLTLEATGARLEGRSAEDVKRVVHLLHEASRQTRSLMADLSPSLLYEAGLGQALRAIARRMGELHSLAIEVLDDGNPKPLGEDYRIVLFRAVQELLHNVVKHAKAANVKVSLQREGTQVRIEVEDDGVGFPLSERRRGDGMREGFGLFSIGERLQHVGGRFEVFSQPGRGVRAVLVAPLQVEGEDEGKEPAAVRILIAEDHKMMRDALAALIEKEPSFEVVGLAEDGLEGVRLAREVKPDVVLMDIHMPRMDGIEATRQITAELPEIKVIGLSVHAEPQIASEMLSAGASCFVPKSSSPEELTAAIRTAVGCIE